MPVPGSSPPGFSFGVTLTGGCFCRSRKTPARAFHLTRCTGFDARGHLLAVATSRLRYLPAMTIRTASR